MHPDTKNDLGFHELNQPRGSESPIPSVILEAGGGPRNTSGAVPSRILHTPPKLTPAWQRERAAWLARVLPLIDMRIARGESAESGFRLYARRSRGRCYKDGRPVRMSENSLSRIYYFWRKSGRSAASLELHYCCPVVTKLTPEMAAAFLQLCCTANAVSFASAYRELKARCAELPYKMQQFYRFFPASQKIKLRRQFRQRVKNRQAENEVRATVAEMLEALGKDAA
jgi:hypothetical protein